MVWDGRWQERAKRGLSMRLQTPPKVEKLRKALHAKAKAEPEFRFYVLYDKVYRADIVAHAYALCRANGGATGMDGETFEAIESRGREAWLGELAQQLRDKRYRAAPVRRVWLEKANGGQRPLGIPTIRDRVVQTAAVLVLEPIFEADLRPEQHAYRAGRSAHDCGEHLLCARLRESNQDASAGSIEELERIVGQIRRHWPRTRINIRGDSGYCRDSLMKWCEDHGVGFVLGLARNQRLVRALGGAMHEAHSVHRRTGKAVRRFRDFTYRTRKSWSRKRRVVGKAEYLSKGENPRFVVTNLSPRKAAARRLYEKLYCARGDMENRIKEQQLDLFADRTSAHTMRANQLRLYFSSFAYVLMHALRRLGTEGTQFARAQCATLRLKLLKIGARVKITARRVWLSFSQAYPYAKTFTQVLANLQRAPLCNPSG